MDCWCGWGTTPGHCDDCGTELVPVCRCDGDVQDTIPTILNAGDNFPELQGDALYIYGDYSYFYDESYGGWIVYKTNTEKSQYEPILESINGKPIKALENTFYANDLLTVAPEIPFGVEVLWGTFCDCTSLVTAPTIPSSVIHMDYYIFGHCESLAGTITINANPSSYQYCFAGVDFSQQNITLEGTSDILDEIRGTSSIN